jgi:beta-fructofuranosidase
VRRGLGSMNLITRRKLLCSAGAAAVYAATPRSLKGQLGMLEGQKDSRLANDPMRPQFHLLPAKNWMNDPNGPIYFNGRYHMFFQYNPHAAVWGDMSWNHAVSSDMLHWTHLPLALTPTPGGPDSYGCFSGSAIQVGKRVYFIYTGTKESTPELATIRDGTDKIQESQCLAWSDDADLVRWTKDPSPILPMPPEGMKITGFRDPSAWKNGSWYYMTVGSGVAKKGGCVLLYRSRDLKSWEYLHELVSGEWNGKPTANPCDDGEMWECPEFFALDGGHVLIYSTLGKVFWQSGELDAAMKFRPVKSGVLDPGAYYAPKTQLDSQGRRVLWGWIPERRPQEAMRKAGWSGMMSLPRVLSLDQDRTLRMKTLPQAATLRSTALSPVMQNNHVTLTLSQANGEFRCSGVSGHGFDVAIGHGETQLLQVSYVPERHLMIADGQEVALQPSDFPTVHGFVDGSVVELILGERMAYTKRFYYEEVVAPEIKISMNGEACTASGWSVQPISNNRLTTPASA